MRKIKVEGYEVAVLPQEGCIIAYVPALPGCVVQCDAKEKEELAFMVARAIGNYLLAAAVAKAEKELLPPRMKPGEKLKPEAPGSEEEM
ncbi:MAG: hypothetical protein AB1657_03115 [Candidatus Micrarchaeota archaeon]